MTTVARYILLAAPFMLLTSTGWSQTPPPKLEDVHVSYVYDLNIKNVTMEWYDKFQLQYAIGIDPGSTAR